jgi:YidC/Oxa1 family membrane protein insertase
MKFKYTVLALVTIFLALCTGLIIESGLFSKGHADNNLITLATVAETAGQADANVQTLLQADDYDVNSLMTMPAQAQIVSIGSKDRQSNFLFELELDSKGAAISRAYLNRFDNLDYKDPQPYLQLLSPVEKQKGQNVLSLANDTFILVEQKQKLRLNNLDWKFVGKKQNDDGSEQAEFSADILTSSGKDVIRISKVYTITPGINHIQCSIKVENVSQIPLTSRFDIQSPLGMPKEGTRTDLRKIITGYKNAKGQIETVTKANTDIRKNIVKWLNGKMSQLDKDAAISLASENAANDFLWVSTVDKYFAAIVRPVPSQDANAVDWVKPGLAEHYEPGLQMNPSQKESKQTGSGFKFNVKDFTLAPGQSKEFVFQVYLGAKDKELFEQNPLYSSLGFIKTFDLQTCCSMGWITSLAFFILTVMKWMYMFIPNYGVVIIILVLFVRLLLHPITKRSQVSMMSMQKLGPMSEEIRKKYANNKTEMNKQMMLLYREKGTSPIMGCLPMLLQMPIWIALYSAIQASVELRGEPFLPFWITDLSSPDAIFRFKAFTIPLLNAEIESFNLLPLLLGVSFYLQQKLTPQTAAGADPRVAQQQKMMLWMMPIMMLVFLYNAPSGLNLYIMASTFGGVIEQYVIRKHIREKQEAEAEGRIPVTSKTGGKIKKKKPKPFFKNQM